MKLAVSTFVLFLSSSFFVLQNAYAFDSSLFMGDARGGGGKHQLEYSFNTIVGKQNKQEHRLRALGQIDPDPKNTWSVPVQARELSIVNAPLIPGTSIRAPQRLWSLGVGVNHARELENNRKFGIQFNVSSPSDKPFSGIQQTAFDLTSFYKIPESRFSDWWLFLSFSTNRAFLNFIPLPGFAYSFISEDRKFFGFVGLPFFMGTWNPAPRWRLQAFVLALWSQTFETSYGITDTFRIYAQYTHQQQHFLRAGRDSFRNRLFLDEMKAVLGVKTPLSSILSADLSLGHAFQRKLFESPSFFKRPSGTQVLEEGATLTAQLTAQF